MTADGASAPDFASHAVVTADRSGTIRAWSAGATVLFAIASDDAVGASLDVIVPEAYRARHWDAFRRAMRSGDCHLARAAISMAAAVGNRWRARRRRARARGGLESAAP